MIDSGDEPSGHPVTFGSASLLEDDTDVVAARAVLEAALDAGAGRLDVAPMYGHGLSEALVLSLGAERGVPVTTKVGIEPQPPSPRLRRLAAAAARRLPHSIESMARRAVGAATTDPFAASGRFAPDAVRSSVERSLRLAGRIDRLLLHEVQPPDVTDELLGLLARYLSDGDVAETGCATRNVITEHVLARGGGVLTVVHVSAAPLGDPIPAVPPGTRLVGHGTLGAGGSDLRRLRTLLDGDRAWTAATAGTVFDDAGGDGVVRALMARAWTRGLDEVLVATTRSSRAPGLVKAAASGATLTSQQSGALERAIVRARNHGRGGPRAD